MRLFGQLKIEDLFLSLLKNNHGHEVNEKFKHLKAEHWDALSHLANRTGLLPVFYKQLLKAQLETLPAKFTTGLRHLYFLNLRKNLILEQELFKITDYFSNLNIPVIPLKGPVLARYLHQDLAFRQTSTDLDLLIRYEDIEKIEPGLKRLGYVVLENSSQNIAESLRYTPAVSLEKYFNNNESIILDLQKNLRRFFSIDPYPEIWENIRLCDLDGHKVWIPYNEDLLLYLAMVAISTFEFVELRYIYDIHKLITSFSANLNWNSLINKSRKASVIYALYFALKLSRELFGTVIPDECLKRIKPNILKERFFRCWINKKNIFSRRHKIASTYTWRYFVCGYLYAKNLFDFLKKVHYWVFSTNEDTERMSANLSLRERRYLPLKRLLKPMLAILR